MTVGLIGWLVLCLVGFVFVLVCIGLVLISNRGDLLWSQSSLQQSSSKAAVNKQISEQSRFSSDRAMARQRQELPALAKVTDKTWALPGKW